MRGKILRGTELKNGRWLYAAKFVELCHEEEIMIRRSVFSVQIQNSAELNAAAQLPEE